MQISVKKLETETERYAAERLITTSFLHEWDEQEARAHASAPEGEAWGAFNEENQMISAVTALRHELTYEGGVIPCGEFHMVGTLPEARGSGAVRSLMSVILRDCRARGDLFATLIPFSFAFYRKYGFESASEMLEQKAEIGQFAPFKEEFAAKQILSQADTDKARLLYENFCRRYNFAYLKTAEDWKYRENGEFGQRDWQYSDKTHYSYLFCDGSGKPRAYFTFVFVYGPDGPFTGTMAVTELVFDSPEALKSVFGFFYGMRAKVTAVSVELPRDVDLSLMLPECDSVERKLDGHVTARVLNPDKVLLALKQPEGEGRYSIHVEDAFLPENTGTYTVCYKGGKAVAVSREAANADLELTVETFCQLAVGLTDLNGALYREGTRVNSNRELLDRVFVKKPLFFC